MLPVDDNPGTLTAGFVIRQELTISYAPSGRQSTAAGCPNKLDIIRQELSLINLSSCGFGEPK